MKSENVLIFGAGSVGSYLAAKIYKSHYNVDIIGRKAKNIGSALYINSDKYDFPRVFNKIDTGGHYDYLFLTSKILDLKTNLKHLAETHVNFRIPVLVQNCFFDMEEYKQIIGGELASILVYDGFNLSGNRLDHISGAGFFTEDSRFSNDVYLLLKNAGIQISKTDNMVGKRAEKTIYNCSVNIFSALYLKTLKELFEDQAMVRRIQDVFHESYEVMAHIVTTLPDKKSMWNNFFEVVRHMDHYASTYQDVKRNKRTELPHLNGFIIESGRKMNINTPHNMEITDEFKAKHPDLYQAPLKKVELIINDRGFNKFDGSINPRRNCIVQPPESSPPQKIENAIRVRRTPVRPLFTQDDRI